MSKFWFRVNDDIFNKGLTKHEILIYVYLSKLCNQTGRCVVRHATIAEKTDTSRATVKRALNTLYNKKLILKRKRKNGANEYILVRSNMVQLPQDPPAPKNDKVIQEYPFYDWLESK